MTWTGTTTATTRLILTCLLVLVGCVAPGCTSTSNRRPNAADGSGQVTLGLTLSPNVAVNSVSYQITGNGLTAITGNIDVSNMTHATALVTGIPVGMGYQVAMDATSVSVDAGSSWACHGMASFDIQSGQTAMVQLVLQCRLAGADAGAVAITGRFDDCVYISSYGTSALEAPVGSPVMLSVKAVDVDPSDTVMYSWTATPSNLGTFGTATASSTTFTCQMAGSVLISIAVTDGTCGDSRNPAVPLICDPPATGSGGTGGIAGAGGHGGAGNTTGAAGAGGTAAGGGAGTGAAGAQGSAGSSGTAGTTGAGGAGAACTEPVTGGASCDSCTTGQCALGASGTDGCCALASAADQALCAAVVACYANPPGGTPCTISGDPTNCFCGTSGGGCFSASATTPANGPCTAVAYAAVKLPATQASAPTVQAQFYSPGSPLGRAGNLTTCRGSYCAGECSIP